MFYDGRDLYEDYDELRLRLGFVPQGDVLHEALTVGQTLEYAAQLRFSRDVSSAERRLQIEQLLDQLGIAAMTDVVVGRLSGASADGSRSLSSWSPSLRCCSSTSRRRGLILATSAR